MSCKRRTSLLLDLKRPIHPLHLRHCSDTLGLPALHRRQRNDRRSLRSRLHLRAMAKTQGALDAQLHDRRESLEHLRDHIRHRWRRGVDLVDSL